MHRVVGAVVVMGMICLAGMVHEWMIRVPSQSGLVAVDVPPDTTSVSAPLPSNVRRTPVSTPSSFLTDPLVFLSHAPLDSLDLLPGIGPVLAARIVEARESRGEFADWSEVLAIKGIGPRMIARWQTLATR